jgi:acyl-CoA thioesterase
MGLIETLRLKIGAVRERTSHVSMTVEEIHHNYVGTLHGGVVSTLIDIAIARAIRDVIDPNEVIATVALNLTFIHAVSSGDLNARGRVTFKGNRLAHGEAEVYAGDQIIARGTGTWYISRKKTAATD